MIPCPNATIIENDFLDTVEAGVKLLVDNNHPSIRHCQNKVTISIAGNFNISRRYLTQYQTVNIIGWDRRNVKDRIFAITKRINKCIRPQISGKAIIAQASGKGIIRHTSKEGIIARATIYNIATIWAMDDVISIGRHIRGIACQNLTAIPDSSIIKDDFLNTIGWRM